MRRSVGGKLQQFVSCSDLFLGTWRGDASQQPLRMSSVVMNWCAFMLAWSQSSSPSNTFGGWRLRCLRRHWEPIIQSAWYNDVVRLIIQSAWNSVVRVVPLSNQVDTVRLVTSAIFDFSRELARPVLWMKGSSALKTRREESWKKLKGKDCKRWKYSELCYTAVPRARKSDNIL